MQFWGHISIEVFSVFPSEHWKCHFLVRKIAFFLFFYAFFGIFGPCKWHFSIDICLKLLQWRQKRCYPNLLLMLHIRGLLQNCCQWQQKQVLPNPLNDVAQKMNFPKVFQTAPQIGIIQIRNCYCTKEDFPKSVANGTKNRSYPNP